MGFTYNNLVHNLTLFSALIFPPSLLSPTFSLFFFFFAIFSLSIILSLKKNSFYIKEPEGALVRPRWLRDEGNDIPATAKRRRHLWWAFLSHSLSAFPCLLPIGLDLCFPCLDGGDGKRWWWLSLPIYLISAIFFSLDNEVRNFMDND
jgi:hypothetical protein